MNFLRTTSTGRLVAGLALTVAVIAGGVAVAGRRRRRRQSAPAEGAGRRHPRRARRAQARGRHGTHPLHEQPDLQRSPHHRLSAALGRLRTALDLGRSRAARVAVGRGRRAGHVRRRPPVDLRRIEQHRLPRERGLGEQHRWAGKARPRRAERRADLVRPPAAGRAGDRVGRAADDAGRTARVQRLHHAQARCRAARPGRDRLGRGQRHPAAHRGHGSRQQHAGARARGDRHQLRQRRSEHAGGHARRPARRSSTSPRRCTSAARTAVTPPSRGSRPSRPPCRSRSQRPTRSSACRARASASSATARTRACS